MNPPSPLRPWPIAVRSRTAGLVAALCGLCALPGCDTDDPIDLGAPECDPLDAVECALPWPSNLYLKEDPAQKTGYALRFGANSLPPNKSEVPVAPDAYNKLDGYGVGSPLLTVFPDIDISALATEDHIERSLVTDASIVWLEVGKDGVRRVPYWVELDAYETDPARRLLFVRPAVILKEATRYVVAFRNLRTTAGAAIAPSPAFQRLRDGKTDKLEALKARQPRFDQVFADLAAQGLPRESLTLAWDFVTASSATVHGDLLTMRDDALGRLPGIAAPLTVTKVTEYVPTADNSGKPVNEYIGVEIEGTFEVPDYLEPLELPGFTGSRIRRDGSGRPLAQGTRKPTFWVRIPYTALGNNAPRHGLVMYGHGLLGDGEEVRAGQNGKMANDYKLIFFSANMLGMSEEDSTLVALTLAELTRFRSLADRLHQGMVNWVVLTRAIRDGLGRLPEVSGRKVQINPDEVFYSGISQGGIFGGTFLALTPDITYGHLGVPGNNYSTLLQRSVDFNQFFVILSGSYRTPTEQAILLSAIQLLWDSTDPVTHLRHLSTAPHPGNKPHYALLGPAKGDFQVAVVTNENTARSDLGFALMENYDTQRQVYGVTPQKYPHTGSGIVLWDFGNAWPAPGNVPPKDPKGDPHSKPRKLDTHSRQMVEFFRTGTIIDVCGGDGCHPD